MNRNSPKISILIPVLNEETHIGRLITYLKQHSDPDNILEILVVDGGSTDQTIRIVKELGATVLLSDKGRAKQMNLGARVAKGQYLYFLHADTLPPPNFDIYIINALDAYCQAGCFQMRFDSDHWLLKLFAWFTRYNVKLCRGGDQSLFIYRTLFDHTKGFNEDYMVFEDNEYIGRLYKLTQFKILPQQVETSARKYRKKGVVRLQYHFGMIHLKNYFGAGPDQLYDYYQRKIAL